MKEPASSSFEKAYLAGKTLTGVLSLDGGILDDQIENYTFRDCTIINGGFTCSNFEHCVFENVIFDGVDLSVTIFRDCIFQGLTLKKCTMDLIRMEGCSGEPPTILPS